MERVQEKKMVSICYTQMLNPYSELSIGFTWPQNKFLMATEILCQRTAVLQQSSSVLTYLLGHFNSNEDLIYLHMNYKRLDPLDQCQLSIKNLVHWEWQTHKVKYSIPTSLRSIHSTICCITWQIFKKCILSVFSWTWECLYCNLSHRTQIQQNLSHSNIQIIHFQIKFSYQHL
jgi:hypothetical protein